MNIIYFGNGSFLHHKRGVENVIEMQSQALPFETVYYIHWGDEVKNYQYGKYNCYSVKNGRSLYFVLNKIMKQIYNKQNTIIHSHNPLMTFFYKGKTDVFTVHDGLYYQSKSEGAGKLKRSIFHFIEKVVYRKTRIVHFISNFTKEMSLFGAGKNDTLIYNTSFLEGKANPKRILSNNATAVSCPIKVLSVRSIEERARFDLLLEVAQMLKDTHHFDIAGKGPLLEHYRNLTKTKNISNVTFHGFVDDEILMNLYSNTDVVLTLAEYGEGFGLPIIEGYVFNKAVYASNKCAIPEVIIDEQYLLDNSVQSIVEKIKVPLIMQGMNYRLYYDKRFSNQIFLQEVKDLYIKIKPADC